VRSAARFLRVVRSSARPVRTGCGAPICNPKKGRGEDCVAGTDVEALALGGSASELRVKAREKTKRMAFAVRPELIMKACS
jgi:hypothetical protein